MITIQSLQAKLLRLRDKINATTGVSDKDLTQAVNRLISQGGTGSTVVLAFQDDGAGNVVLTNNGIPIDLVEDGSGNINIPLTQW